MQRTAFIALALLVTTTAAFGQVGTITDGDVTFAYNGPTGIGGALADFEVDNGTDHLFAQWWWYRLAGDTAETVFPEPVAENYAGNMAMLSFMLSPTLSASETVTVSDTGTMAGTVVFELTITNNGAGVEAIELFNYADFDVDATLTNSAALLTPTNIGIIETSVANFRGLGADAYEVDSFSTLVTALDDAAITNLANTGLPFGPADFTGAYQWSLELGPGESVTVVEALSVNDGAAPLELAFSGSCPGAVQVRIAGATPGGTVAVAGGSSYGSFTIPAGGCAGTELGIAGPGLLATPSADGAGEISINLNLPAAACDQIVQAVDLTSCGATNTDPVP